MRKTRFTEEQMVTILREADERPVPEVAKKHGVSSQTIYGWRKHFGKLEPADVKRLRQLEQENGRLKKMVADRDLEIDVLKEITRKNGRRTRASAAGRVCPDAWPVVSPRVRLAFGSAVVARLRVAVAETRCACGAGHARVGWSVPTVRLPEDPDLPRAPGPCDERREDSSSVATSWAPGAETTSSAPSRHEPSEATASHGDQSCVGV